MAYYFFKSCQNLLFSLSKASADNPLSCSTVFTLNFNLKWCNIFKKADISSFHWRERFGCCWWEMERNNGMRACTYSMCTVQWFFVRWSWCECMKRLLWGRLASVHKTASCHYPITFPFPACPVVLLMYALFKYRRTRYATAYSHACINTDAHANKAGL